jgi:NADH-quinone oxidoreductase subunit J
MVVTTRNLVHAALWLVVSLFGVAVVFTLLNAPFLAVAQVLVYIGAIAILFIFAVMLTRRLVQDTGPQTNRGWWLAALIAALLFVGLAWMVGTWDGFATQAPALAADTNSVRELGAALVSPDAYVLPFELASVLLLAALIGAIVVASETN